MSRTYRKNARWYHQYKGNLYRSCFSGDVSLKGKPKEYEVEPELPWSFHFCQAYVYTEVTVGDTDCLGSPCSGPLKKDFRRIDRARRKAELIKDMKKGPEEVNDNPIISSYDPWDWD